MPAKIPSDLMHDRYWGPTLFLFSKQEKLKEVMTTEFFDMDELTIEIQELKKVSAPWSRSEKIMLQLALHLCNEQNAFNLSDLDYLDSKNLTLALLAIKMRFGR